MNIPYPIIISFLHTTITLCQAYNSFFIAVLMVLAVVLHLIVKQRAIIAARQENQIIELQYFLKKEILLQYLEK